MFLTHSMSVCLCIYVCVFVHKHMVVCMLVHLFMTKIKYQFSSWTLLEASLEPQATTGNHLDRQATQSEQVTSAFDKHQSNELPSHYHFPQMHYCVQT